MNVGGIEMDMTFRWFGEKDPVSLEHIRQIPGVSGVVSALYDIPVGEVWPIEKIKQVKQQVHQAGLKLEVIESVPVHEDIKLGYKMRDRYIDHYKQTIRNLAQMGIQVICYNFMPVFDWTRTQLDKPLGDGSTTLAFYHEQLHQLSKDKTNLSLPGWDTSYQKKELQQLLQAYQHVSQEDLWSNLTYFLREIIPVAEESDVYMAIHPDDPPWSLFGLPRIITNEASLDRLIRIVDSPSNGLTLCSGSLGCNSYNDVAYLASKYTRLGKVPFVHMRNIKRFENGNFEESAHLSAAGDLDMVSIMESYAEAGFNGYMRPDHGRMIWGEEGKAGYGLFDRALGASYLQGIWETVKK